MSKFMLVFIIQTFSDTGELTNLKYLKLTEFDDYYQCQQVGEKETARFSPSLYGFRSSIEFMCVGLG